MKGRAIVGVVLLAIGAVWIFQGSGVLKGSFMTGESLWLWIGIACAAGGAIVLYGAFRPRAK